MNEERSQRSQVIIAEVEVSQVVEFKFSLFESFLRELLLLRLLDPTFEKFKSSEVVEVRVLTDKK